MYVPSCTIIIPVYKEPRIKKTILEILHYLKPKNLDFEIIVIVDCAKNDYSDIIVKELSENYKEIKTFINKEKKGIASAIKTGIQNAKNDVTLIAMGDGSETPENLLKLVLKMSENYDMVFANRFSSSSHIQSYPKMKLLANRLCNFSIQLLFNFNSSDISNAVKVYKTLILKNLIIESTGFEIFIEIPIKLFKNGYKNFIDVPISHDAGDVKDSKFNLIIEGPRYFKTIMKCRFNNYS